jgi:DNA mismatch endonuclease (patch repair protein)
MDKLSPERRSANMRKIRSEDTTPEVVLRSLVHRLGYRFRLHRKDLPGKPDLVFPSLHKIIFVHGCFWHQHNKCVDGRIPKSREEYWGSKLARNVQRDRSNRRALRKLGWSTLVIWECELDDPPKLTRRLRRFFSL